MGAFPVIFDFVLYNKLVKRHFFVDGLNILNIILQHKFFAQLRIFSTSYWLFLLLALLIRVVHPRIDVFLQVLVILVAE
jgi:hypothetical protein